MDDEKEYQELVKAEAQEERDTKMVMKTFKILMVLIVIGILIATASQIAHFIEWNALPWATGHATEPNIIERSTP